MAEIFGNSTHLVKQFIVDTHGKEFFNKILEETTPAVKEQLQGIILSTQNYDFEIYKQLLEVFKKNIKSHDDFVAMTKYKYDNQTNWLYKVMCAITPWKFFVSNVQKIYRMHVSEGECSGKFINDNKFIIKLAGIEYGDAVGDHFAHYMRFFYEMASKKKMKCSYDVLDKERLVLTYEII